jgi:cytochrome c556
MKKKIMLAITAVATLSMAAVVMGQGPDSRPTPDQAAVGFRQALMTLIGGEKGPLTLMQRGRMPYNQALVKKNADNLVVLAGMISDAFQRNTSNATDVKTRALPVVWQDHDEFLMHARDLKMQAEAIETAANGGNEEAVKEAIKNTGACDDCHMKFRMK